jgi:predicted dehydrogenase
MNAGKDVYIEKPIVQLIDEGKDVIETEKKTGRIVQVGSQRVSSLTYQKAKDLIAAGAIGEVNLVDAWIDRNSAQGAWQYSIPPDATPANIDWDRFLGRAPKRPFEPIRLFRWRNYRDYGTGVGGDLFVHLLSGLHVVTGSAGPERIFATGGLRFWEDGRDVPDVMLAMFDYGKQATHGDFTFSLRVNLKSGVPEERFGFRFMGTDGVITTSMSSLTMEKPAPETAPGHSIGTFAKATQEKFLEEYRAKYPPGAKAAAKPEPEKFAPPAGYDAHREHHRVFYEAIRAKKKPVEDAVFGFRAAGPALLANTSYFEKRIVLWDPVGMTIKKG